MKIFKRQLSLALISTADRWRLTRGGDTRSRVLCVVLKRGATRSFHRRARQNKLLTLFWAARVTLLPRDASTVDDDNDVLSVPPIREPANRARPYDHSRFRDGHNPTCFTMLDHARTMSPTLLLLFVENSELRFCPLCSMSPSGESPRRAATFTSMRSAAPLAGSSRRGRLDTPAFVRARNAAARRELPTRRHGRTRGRARVSDDRHTTGETSSDRRRRTRTAVHPCTAETADGERERKRESEGRGRRTRLVGDGRRCATTCDDDART